ncbi:NB-ARC [Macleaya cordata]|uniref:NB-ARC n=1 Tax=Macleaya cordata TaxID=56857 RepID=A0A200QNC8_MACCD|nr:NB-ARC [Macleaya cordata]
MVGKCGGLPLGLIVLGGLLLKKSPSTHEWQRVLNHISRKLMEDQDHHTSQILALSYNDLPFELKSCFLHIGLFPEDSVIDTKKLIHLWVAEGFIPQREEPMEDVAEDYLNELTDRSMIQVVHRKSSWELEECSCSIHDLLRDLAISKAEEVRFLQIYGKEDPPPFSARPPRGRRFAIHSENQSYALKDWLPPNLCSLVIFNTDATTTIRENNLRSLYVGFKFLRVLDLGCCRFDKNSHLQLPDKIGEMIHLRYLCLKDTYVEELPTSIGNFQRLQTLDLTGHFECKLPDTVGKLGKLRHLYGCWAKKMPRIDTLTNLQRLNSISFDIWMQNDTAKLTNLRELKMTGVRRDTDTRSLSESLARLGSNLQSLSVSTGEYG